MKQVSCNSLRDLNISFTTPPSVLEETLDAYRADFTALDNHLQQPNFSNLAAVTIGWRSHPGSLDFMKSLFPRTVARGLMRMVDIEEMDEPVHQGRGAATLNIGYVESVDM